MITVYSRENCRPCRMSKMYLDNNNISYTVVDVDQDVGALDMLKELGHMALPVIKTATDHWSGYNPDKLSTLKLA